MGWNLDHLSWSIWDWTILFVSFHIFLAHSFDISTKTCQSYKRGFSLHSFIFCILERSLKIHFRRESFPWQKMVTILAFHYQPFLHFIHKYVFEERSLDYSFSLHRSDMLVLLHLFWIPGRSTMLLVHSQTLLVARKAVLPLLLQLHQQTSKLIFK